jgi:uncharacterized protein involved in type VI secretion and phage assembly
MDTCDVIVLASSGELPLHTLLGQQASLEISLANGTRTAFTGLVSEAAMLGSTGSLVRYRLRLSSLLWPLSQSRNNCVWQDKSVIDIVESVLLRYPEFADWRWNDEVTQFMASIRPRNPPGQYAYAIAGEAEHYARLRIEAMEAANQRWQTRSTVRTLRPGTRFSLTQGPKCHCTSMNLMRR